MQQADTGFVPFDRREIEQSIPDRFAKQVRHSPQSVAVWSEERCLTYDALDRYANRIAMAIVRHRIPHATSVAILLPQGVDHIAAILGVLKAGRHYVPLDPASSTEELRAILLDSGSSLIVSNGSSAGLARNLSNGLPVCDVDALDQSLSDAAPELPIGPDSLAYIYYTSGTTGQPKGVVDNHRNVLHNVMRYTNSLEIRRADRLTLLQSPAFSGSVSSLFCALLNGATCYPFDLRRLGFNALASLIKERKLTILHSVPTVFQHLVETGVPFPSLRIIRLEGDQVHHHHIEAYRKHFGAQCVLVNGMGATETGLTRQYFIDHDMELAGGLIPIGYPTDDMETILIDEFGIEVTAGQIGEIAVRSRYLALGYWNRPSLTSERFRRPNGAKGKRTYRTGDFGRFRTDGCLEYLGRRDYQIKIRGRRVDLQQIEREIRALPSVVDAVVVSHPSEAGDTRLVGYVVAVNSPPTSSALRRALAETLPTRMIPTAFVVLDEIPVDDNGKIRRRDLPTPSNARPSQDTPFVSPRDNVERALVEICGSLLGITTVGAEDDLFDLGFDSLLLLRLLAKVNDEFSQDLSSGVFLNVRTIAQLADRLRQCAPRDTLIPLQSGTRAPCFLVHAHRGQVLHYGRLASRMERDRPLVAVQSPARQPFGTTVEDLATHHVTAIRRVQEHGPYLLGGYCFGALVAFEMAQQLHALGETVPLLILLDPDLPGGEAPQNATRVDLISKIRRHVGSLRSAELRHWAPYLRTHGQRVLRRVVRRTRHRVLSVIYPALQRPITTSVVDDWAQRACRMYRPKPYVGAALVIGHVDGTGAVKHYESWQGILCGEYELRYIEAPERSMFQEPYVRELAALLNNAIDGW